MAQARRRPPVDPFFQTRGRHNVRLGRHGEDLAAAHLEAAGYKILERNVHVGGGEIDLIAEHRGETVFVEVKTRRPGPFGEPGEAITATKARRLARAAQGWLAARDALDSPCRCDVVAITEDASGTDGTVEIWPNALLLGDYL